MAADFFFFGKYKSYFVAVEKKKEFSPRHYDAESQPHSWTMRPVIFDNMKFLKVEVECWC